MGGDRKWELLVTAHHCSTIHVVHFLQEKFEDTKGIIRTRKSKKDKQCNGQNEKQKTKRTNKNKKSLLRKLQIDQQEPH